MSNILSELYNDLYSVQNRSFQPDSAYNEMLEKADRLEKELMQALSEELKQKFISYQDAAMHLSSLTGEMDFKEGFRLGMRLMAAALNENVPS